MGAVAPCGAIASTVWYRFTPTTDVSVQADTFGSGYDTVLAAYTGTSVADLALLACNDDDGETLQSSLSLSLTAGTTYFLQVGGFRGCDR